MRRRMNLVQPLLLCSLEGIFCSSHILVTVVWYVQTKPFPCNFWGIMLIAKTFKYLQNFPISWLMCWHRFYLVLEKQMYWLILIGLMEAARSHFRKLEESEKRVDGCVFLFFNTHTHNLFLIVFAFPSNFHFLLCEMKLCNCHIDNCCWIFRFVWCFSFRINNLCSGFWFSRNSIACYLWS